MQRMIEQLSQEIQVRQCRNHAEARMDIPENRDFEELIDKYEENLFHNPVTCDQPKHGRIAEQLAKARVSL